MSISKKDGDQRMKELFLELLVLYGCGLLYYTPLLFVVWGDIVGFLIKIFRLKKNVRGYETQKLFFKSVEFKEHKKRWLKKFLYPLAICGAFWIVFKVFGISESLAIAGSHFVMLVCFVSIADKETKARKQVRQSFLDRINSSLAPEPI